MDLEKKVLDLETTVLAFRKVSELAQLTPEQAAIANQVLDHLNSLRELTKKDLNSENEPVSVNENVSNDLDSNVAETDKITSARKQITKRIE